MLSVTQAVAAMAAAVSPIADRETLPLTQADGRILAAALVSTRDLPPFANSAVDGYAVALADLAARDVLPVRGRVAAGVAGSALEKGACLRIFTGAPMPCGADTVFMQEDVAFADGMATFQRGLRRGDNTRARGEDLACGDLAVPAGRRLRPQDLSLAAAVGVEALTVVRQLRAALFSTGDEIVERGAAPGRAQRYDSNRIMLATLLSRAGVIVTDLGILRDDRAGIAEALAGAEAGHDLVITSGGVSVGEEDHVKAAVAARGELALWRLAIKPGRPVAFGRIGAVPFVGLPGNPVAAFVTFTQVLRPFLARLSGETLEHTTFSVVSDFEHCKRPGLREYVRASLDPVDGVLRARKCGMEGAAVLTSLTQSLGLVELPEHVTRVAPGDVLAFLPYGGLL